MITKLFDAPYNFLFFPFLKVLHKSIIFIKILKVMESPITYMTLRRMTYAMPFALEINSFTIKCPIHTASPTAKVFEA